MDNLDYDDEASVSSIHLGVAPAHRKNTILNCITNAALTDNFQEWFKLLTILNREVSYDYSTEEDKEDMTLQKQLVPLTVLFQQKMSFNQNINRYCLKQNETFEEYGLLYSLLDKYQRFILKALDKRGWLPSVKKDEEGLLQK